MVGIDRKAWAQMATTESDDVAVNLATSGDRTTAPVGAA